jgi:hypothetical protein
MLRRAVEIFVVLFGGLLFAFGAVFAGCDGPAPRLGDMCGHNILGSLAVFTLAGWFVLAVAVSLFNALRRNE